MDPRLVAAARRGNLVVLAGAGVSAAPPSALPGWYALNEAIVRVLCRRLEQGLARPDWLSDVASLPGRARPARFPPDYQAQLIEEMCGDRYFRALQALDVASINAGHVGIAALGSAGALRAVVTTNFDRLIEYAADHVRLTHRVARDDSEYVAAMRVLAERSGPVPIIKVHGCVSDHRSMIDTLKQRKRGRTPHLQACLDELQDCYWLYLGFSAADLETDADYLGLVARAERAEGATFVAYPGDPQLGAGGTLLMEAHGDRAAPVVVAHVADFLRDLCRALDVPSPAVPRADGESGAAQFARRLDAWGDDLSLAAAGLCLASILEAIGEAEPAVRILDRLVRKELHDARTTDDYHALQLHYGRLGAAWGRFVAVPDLNGSASNASVESIQSLLRIRHTSLAFAATSWLACAQLWMNQGEAATRTASWLLQGMATGVWNDTAPPTDEEVVDGWLSAAQVFTINSGSATHAVIVATASVALDRARRCGDAVRAARVAALEALAHAETVADVPAILEAHDAAFADAERVGDGFSLGIRALALARWHVGAGGRARWAGDDGRKAAARRALVLLDGATAQFRSQGMDPWLLYALLQRAKAYADLEHLDDAKRLLVAVGHGIDRFPVLASHYYEVVGQLLLVVDDPEQAEMAFNRAREAAAESGLRARDEAFDWYLRAIGPRPPS